MNNIQRILGTFTAVATLGLGLTGCSDKKVGVQQTTAQGTRVSVYPDIHVVRERISDDVVVGADFKQNVFFKTIVFSSDFKTDDIVGPNDGMTTTLTYPFADIQDQATLEKITYLRTHYDQVMFSKPSVSMPDPQVEAAPKPVAAPK